MSLSVSFQSHSCSQVHSNNHADEPRCSSGPPAAPTGISQTVKAKSNTLGFCAEPLSRGASHCCSLPHCGCVSHCARANLI